MSATPERSRSVPKSLLAALSALGIAALVLLFAYRAPLFDFFGDPQKVRAWVAEFGALAPLAAIVLAAALVIIAPIPNQFVGMANGYLFGVALGTTYSMIGLVLGTMVSMTIARRLGRPWVERFVPSERLERWNRVTSRWGPLVFFIAYLVPGLPDDLLCFVIGLSRLQLGPMLVLVTIGRLPGMMGASWVGANAGDMPFWVWPLVVGMGVVLAIVLFFFGDRIEAASVALGRRLGRHRREDDSA
jgi:uncharacterized membrane protein YdjX (TVP38/TMEM64 family)